ncbi:beta-lactamase/transpeptidase-like protein [Lentithecium fluviatile CBS 122367]|uniref:Beta-lactamase/transpeptidase-like protein n=1 Tax=Lentithecium fluviatile CBS 122367 TaxID=1168545 RepID=A0A6G1IQC8_9PLEO|nr:beta-lactamase/transpeptidase-like protein [Lentithecium fluviatile CBS 122367]
MEFEKAYEKAVEDNILPGYALMAGNKNGKVLYSGARGMQSLRDASSRPFQLDTICAIASMTKLMTAVAALQCVEAGLLELDKPVSDLLPEIGKYGIITGFDDEKNEATMVPNSTPITLRMLLSHTNGHEYDWFNPLLMKWRASRGEMPWVGPTVEQKSTLPLIFEPGTSFRYGAGSDWAGKLVEKATGKSLEAFMAERIWGPLGIKDITFYPKKRDDMADRMATISTLNEKGEGPAVDAPDFDILFGGTECLGGGGGFASMEGYFAFLQAVLRKDRSLLNDLSWTELFKPQLNEQCKKAFNDYLKSSPLHSQYLGMCIPTDLEKTWSFAGMICEKGQRGRMSDGSIFWGGVPSMTWYLDFEAGICGVAACQIIPPMSPSVLALHEQFQREMYQKFSGAK